MPEKKRRIIDLWPFEKKLFQVEYFDAEKGKRVSEIISEKSLQRMLPVAHRIDLTFRELKE